jgi:capsular exopolysaccharide synthesis family protein
MAENLNNIPTSTNNGEQEEMSFLNILNISSLLIINWKWFVLSILLCMSIAYTYLRYTTPVYQATAKVLINDDKDTRARRSSLNTTTLGMMSHSQGVENEMVIISSRSIALDVVKKLKLYTTYTHQGRIVDRLMYKTQPLVVDIDTKSLDALKMPITLNITFEKGKYNIHGQYTVVRKNEFDQNVYEPREIKTTLPNIPARIRTSVGYLTFLINAESTSQMKEGETTIVRIVPPEQAAGAFAGRLAVQQVGKATTILSLTYTDISVGRASDYLQQLVKSYNDDSNNDKNIIAARTEEFINNRLEKINAELGMTEGQLESFKRRNRVVELDMTASNAFSQTTNYDQKLADMSTQIALLNSISDYMDMPQNKYQTLPSNVGLTDQAASSLINTYNQIVLDRNRLLRTANENSPTVIPLTEQLNDLTSSIRRAMSQARNNYEIQRRAMQNQYTKYNAQVQQSPMQERILNEIGRQQEVRSGLYLMLLQKREENSIELAATADKGKLIDSPAFAGQISPKTNMIYFSAFGIGFAIPFVIILLIQLLRYKIEGRNDVERLTSLPILADIPVASEVAKGKADIVVKENKNNMMEEVFRSLRTNLQFMLKDGEKTIMLTSNTSGEGKTFIAANLAVSFALLGKKVLLVGLDIRKPRLSTLFDINDKNKGITRILVHDDPTWADICEQIAPSEVNRNLDLLMAGPIPPNPAELLQRDSLDKIFEILRQQYDYIIIDTAPVGLVTDTLCIGRVASATVFVSRADYTPKSAFGFINELSESEKLPNSAIVINAVDLSKRKYGYYYGYGRYGKYGKYVSYKAYGAYGRYGKRYGSYGHYGDYTMSRYGDKDDNSFKR